MQAQGDIRVLRRVGRRLLYGNLVEGNLFGSLPGHIFIVGDGFIQVFPCQAGHVMAGAHAVQHVGLQHGIMGYAVQPNPVVGQHVAVVLQVLTDNQRFLRFQQRAQFFQHLAARDLLRRPVIIMGNGHIGRFAGPHGKRQAHQFRAHIIQAGGFRIEGKNVRPGQLVDPAFQVFDRQNRFIVFLRSANLFLGL